MLRDVNHTTSTYHLAKRKNETQPKGGGMASGMGHTGGEHRRHTGGMAQRHGWAAFDASTAWSIYHSNVGKIVPLGA